MLGYHYACSVICISRKCTTEWKTTTTTEPPLRLRAVAQLRLLRGSAFTALRHQRNPHRSTLRNPHRSALPSAHRSQHRGVPRSVHLKAHPSVAFATPRQLHASSRARARIHPRARVLRVNSRARARTLRVLRAAAALPRSLAFRFVCWCLVLF